MSEQDDIERARRALDAVMFFRDHYGGATPSGTAHVSEIVSMLMAADRKANQGPYGGILTNLADAISKAYLLRPAFAPRLPAVFADARQLGETERRQLLELLWQTLPPTRGG